MAPQMEWKRDAFVISTDPARLDRDVIQAFLAASYWAPGIPRAVVDRSIDHSLPFGIFEGDRQVGFARVITDYATFAYICDVFVLESHRGRGLALWLTQVIRSHPELQGLRRWLLATRDAHALYGKAGFREPEDPKRYMEITNRNVYR
jgi:GNAT superfamily N-acetyltransferase